MSRETLEDFITIKYLNFKAELPNENRIIIVDDSVAESLLKLPGLSLTPYWKEIEHLRYVGSLYGFDVYVEKQR